MQKLQFLRPHCQDRMIPVIEIQRFAGNFHALDNFGGNLCCFDAVSDMARYLEEMFKIFCCARKTLGF